MMATTHGFVALALAVVALPALPSEVSAPLVLTAAFAGGVAPDLDLLADHRRTLHFPVVGSALAVLGAVGSLATSSGTIVLATVFVAAAAVHAASDVLGGSAETEPWNPTTERGVYDHVAGVWRRPRRFVRYSGAPEDFLLALPFAAGAAYARATGPAADSAILAVLVFSGLYALARRHFGRLARVLPDALPRRFRRAASAEDGDDAATTVDN